jgi:protein-disulfide isomerase
LKIWGSEKSWKYSVSIVTIIYIIIFLSLLSFLPGQLSPVKGFGQIPGTTQKETTLSLATLVNQGSPYQGNKSAPVVLVDFSDLQCKLCQRFVKSTEPQINSTYVQTGKIALVFKHLPNRGFDSFPAALAAQCTNEQSKFWPFHNLLYNVQGPIDSGWANKDNLKKLASKLPGLDIQKFNLCFDGQKYKSFIENDLTLAHSLGFAQTPSFIIVKNDGTHPEKIEGPQPFSAFKAVIDKELGFT